jgi:hypothetical protein
MPITLNNSNISVTYNTGSNYIIETVKSDLYVRGTTSGNLSPEPTVSPSIRSDIVVESFTYSGTGDTKLHTKEFLVDTICDILIVGGGGAGADFCGGGGAGAVLYVTNFNIPQGSYSINVGKGGAGGFTVENAQNGISSSITISGITYQATGGGGGGQRVSGGSYTGRKGNDGGSGGGGATSNDVTVQNVGGSSVKNFYPTSTIIYDFTPYNDLTSWKNYATSIGATTLNLDYFANVTTYGQGIWFSNGLGSLQLVLNNSSYNYLKVYFGNVHSEGTVELKINNVIKDTCTAGQFKTYSQSYNTGDILNISELSSIMSSDIVITLMNTNWISLGNSGGEGKDTNSTGYGGGGGGGAGGAGANAGANSGGNGGVGVNLSSIFGTSVGVNGWFGGGGGGGSWSGVNGTGGTGGTGGGGNAFNGNGVNGTGGGGGGGDGGSGGGKGGTGIVILRYRSLAAAPTSINMVKTLNFNYYSSLSPTIYTLTFNTRTLATINNGSDKLLNGSYTITLGNTLSTIVPTTANQNLQDTKYSSSTISISYHTLNPILDTKGAQWTYSSTNPNVYHLGSVGIGTTSPEYSLDVRGNIFTSVGGYTQTGTENWIIQSDRRIKENIVKASYEKCLENVKKIELYNFNFKDNYVNTNDRNQLGFIAQEVQEVYPKAVIVKPDGRIEELLTVNTTQIKYTLYGAVRSLIEKVERIEERVDKLYKLAIPDVEIKEITSKITEIFESTSNISNETSNMDIV